MPVTEPSEVSTPLRGTVGYERKLSQPLPQYEHEMASIFVQFDIDATAGEAAVGEAAKDAFFQARAAVFEQLGIKAEYTDGVLKEVIEQRAVAAVAPITAHPAAAPAAPGAVPAVCTKCNGALWDNRGDKAKAVAEGNASAAKRPDFKCKDKACGTGIWLDARR